MIFHDSLRTYNANQWNETNMKGPLRMGMFTIDPKYTDFVGVSSQKFVFFINILFTCPLYIYLFLVIPKVNMPQYIEKDDRLIPQWAIAVIVIGVGGLLFIIVFGVSVVSQNRSKFPYSSTISKNKDNEFIFQLVNRQNGSKLKPTMSAIYDEEVIKHASSHRSSDYSKPVAHTIWTDPDVSWNDKSFESNSNKVNKRGKQYQID